MKLTQLTPSPDLAHRLRQKAVKDPSCNANQLPEKATAAHSKKEEIFLH